MDEARKGEIALILIENKVSNDGIRFSTYKRSLGNVAKSTGVSLEELNEFMRILIEKLSKETFGEEKVER